MIVGAIVLGVLLAAGVVWLVVKATGRGDPDGTI